MKAFDSGSAGVLTSRRQKKGGAHAGENSETASSLALAVFLVCLFLPTASFAMFSPPVSAPVGEEAAELLMATALGIEGATLERDGFVLGSLVYRQCRLVATRDSAKGWLFVGLHAPGIIDTGAHFRLGSDDVYEMAAPVIEENSEVRLVVSLGYRVKTNGIQGVQVIKIQRQVPPLRMLEIEILDNNSAGVDNRLRCRF